MGVQGLWNLIEEAGHPVNIETLRHKVLAVDLSIWINQSIKGFRDKDGRTVENAHLLGLFYRICKLLFYQIKPIMVFDGECPTLKQRTIQKRQEKTRKTLEKSKNLSLDVLENFISSQIIGPDKKGSSAKIAQELKNRLKSSQKSFVSEFFLPQNNPKQVDVYQSFVELQNECRNSNCGEIGPPDKDGSEEEESIFIERSYHHPQLQSIHDIDVNSEHFKSLPAVTRYEILVELRDSYKQRKSTRVDMLPKESNSFSEFQMAKLLKKRGLQEEIDKLISELNGHIGEDNIELYKNTVANKLDMFDKPSQIHGGTLASDEKTRFLLLKTINQAIEEFSVIEENDSDVKQEFDSQNPIYEVPNDLPGQAKIKSEAERIDFLSSKSSESTSKMFSAKQLSQNIDENFRKYSTKKDINRAMLDLSDDSDSTTSSDDFQEVPPIEEENSQDDIVQIFDKTVPYDICYSLEIPADKQNDQNVTEEGIEMIEEIQANLDSRSIRIVSETDTEIKELKNSEQQGPGTSKSSQVSDTNYQADKTPTQLVQDQVPNKNQKKPLISIEKLIKDSQESNKLNRQSASVTQQMIIECQDLLRLFGIPYIVAPAEAEAQCAMLEQLKLCEGIITDDSDIFLFGGQNVYRNFFTNHKYIMRYCSEDLQRYYGLDRSKLICLGMLCGTDYTLGIENVGPVTGLEILSQFSGKGIEPIEKFACWHRQKSYKNDGNSKPENKLRSSFIRKLLLPPTFPSRVIFDAYYSANVDQSTEPFSWSMPQLSELRDYAAQRFGWSEAKTDAFLLPVLKNLNSKQTQKTIDFYFGRSHGAKTAIAEKLKIKRSKRLNEAIRKNINVSLKSSDNQRLLKRKAIIVANRNKKNQTKTSRTQLVLSEESSSSNEDDN